MLNKQQVKALLDVISSDESRPAICHALLDVYGDNPVLVATNSYMLAAIYLEGTAEDFAKHVGKTISRSELTKWYKLAERKDTLGAKALIEMAQPKHIEWPLWQELVKTEVQPTTHIMFSSRYAKTLEDLANAPLDYSLGGPLAPMAADNPSGLYILMPIKGR